MSKPFCNYFTQVVKHVVFDKPVKVYWNLHKNCYSVQQSGIVVCHTNKIYLKDVSYKVSEKGRQKVLREKRKNVHAFVCGYVSNTSCIADSYSIVTYNPYKNSTFVYKCSGTPVYKSDVAFLHTFNERPYIIGINIK